MFAKTLIVYILASLCEIFGCFSFWECLKLKKTYFLLIPGIISLVLFAYLLTLIDSQEAGRAYAIYGGIYIISSLLWLWIVENVTPDFWDLMGVSFCLVGISMIFFSHFRI